jgi:hypothetical protein
MTRHAHDPAAVYRDVMRDLIASLGLTPPLPPPSP